jgi:hypothetical protein
MHSNIYNYIYLLHLLQIIIGVHDYIFATLLQIIVGIHDYIFATLLHLLQIIVGVHDHIFCYVATFATDNSWCA